MLNVARTGRPAFRKVICTPVFASSKGWTRSVAGKCTIRNEVRRKHYATYGSGGLGRGRNSKASKISPQRVSTQPEEGSSSDSSISESINGRLEQLRDASEKAEYLHVKALVESLVADGGYKPDASIYGALILANADPEHGSIQEISHWYQDMEKAEVVQDPAIYSAVLKALAVHPDQLLRDEVLGNMRDRWYGLSSEDYHYVAAGMIRERKLEQAIAWLQYMREANIGIETWLYDVLIYSLCNVQEIDEALAIMRYRMDHEGRDTIPAHGDRNLKDFISPNVWYHFLDSASRTMHMEGTKYAYNSRVAPGYINPPAGMCQNILICAAKHGNTKLATSVFNILAKRSGRPIQLHHYEILIEAYIASGDLKTAMMLLSTILKTGHVPVKASTRPIFLAIQDSPLQTKAAFSYLQELRDRDRSVPLVALNVLIEACIHMNDLDQAFHIYKTISSFTAPVDSSIRYRRLLPDTETFNLLLQGCLRAQDKSRAILLASEIAAMHIRPDALTYDTLVRICITCDTNTEDARKYIAEAQEAKLDVRVSTMDQLASLDSQGESKQQENMPSVVEGALLGQDMLPYEASVQNSSQYVVDDRSKRISAA